MNDLLKKIKGKGHWKVVIRPTMYDQELFSLGELEDSIRESKVRLRGWDYPHINSRNGIKMSSEDSIFSSCDWPEGPVYEYWRAYSTGQFVHYFVMREDWRMDKDKLGQLQREYYTETDKFLSILSTLYTVTEIFKFASDFYSKKETVSGIEVIIELHDVKGRVLMFWDSFSRYLSQAYTCGFENGIMQKKKRVPKSDLLNKFSDIALDIALSIFRSFDWKDPSREVFEEDQKRFLERRL